MIETGTVKTLSLRDVFPGEATDFTPWLEDNIGQLGEAVGIHLVKQEREYQLDNFRVDIVATVDDDTETRVAIENQFGGSDHDHLGKLVTYAATLGAKAAIWIVENARTEHVTAINELNECRCGNCGFGLIEAKVITINDSLPAVIFNVVVQPNVEIETSEPGSTNTTRQDFWTCFADKCHDIGANAYIGHKATSLPFYMGRSYRGTNFDVYVRKDNYSLRFQFDWMGGAGEEKKEKNERNFHAFEEHKAEIEDIFGEELEWELKPDCNKCSINKTYTDGSYTSPASEWERITTDMAKRAKRFEEAITKFYCLLS